MKMDHVADICAYLGDEYDRYLGAIVPPLFQNSLFTRKKQNHGYAYTRINNPTVEILEEKLAALEHAPAARVFSSGMAAISATISSVLQRGDHVLSLRSAYYPVSTFLKEEMARFGVEVDFLGHFTKEELEQHVKPNTRLLYFESPSSNIFRILPIREITAFAKERGVVTVMDNTWATPLYQNPLDLGVDYSIHSATKYLGGHSDVIAGVVVGQQEAMDALREKQRAGWGGCLDPFAAWLLTRSLRTFEIRMKQHSETAGRVAEYLQAPPKVKKVYYPGLKQHEGHELAKTQMRGFSGLMSMVLNADKEQSMKFVKSLELFQEGPSWGGFESVVNTPGITTAKEIIEFEGVPEGLIRLSIGLESAESLMEDLEQALAVL